LLRVKLELTEISHEAGDASTVTNQPCAEG
jgi:hypothetical protein